LALDIPFKLLDYLVDHSSYQSIASCEVIEDATLAEAGLGCRGIQGEPGYSVTQDHFFGRVDDAILGVAATA
jgi:hypothetical protein